MCAFEGSFPGLGTFIHLSACSVHNMIVINLGCRHVCVWVFVRAAAVKVFACMQFQLLLPSTVVCQ